MQKELQLVQTNFFIWDNPADPLYLRCGEKLERFQIAYETYGELNSDRNNAILLFHAMTGSQHAAGINKFVPDVYGRWTEEMHIGWWNDFIGPGKALDTNQFFVICANYLGGCYGSTGPASINPATGKPWGRSFPAIRICDIVDSQIRLLDHLGIETLHAAVGASIGGFLCLSLVTRYPYRVDRLILIGTGCETTTLTRILNFEQITAIEADPHFYGGDYYEYNTFPATGLALARRIAHKTFVSTKTLNERARGEIVAMQPPHAWYAMNNPVESYMLHQGKKFVKRFDANSYLRILDAWQWFDLANEAGFTHTQDAFNRCAEKKFLVFTIDSDISFYPEEQAKLVRHLKEAGAKTLWITVHSDKGHDSFLLEPHLYTPHMRAMLMEEENS